MASRLTDLLREDHHRILSMGQELMNECGGGALEGACFTRFRTFKALASAQAKAEELTVYALFEENPPQAMQELKRYVLEAYEEHDLMDLLLKEMGQAEELTDRFRAQLSVYMRLLDRHLKGEARDFLPKVEKVLDEGRQTDLAVMYTRERESLFAKKSGRKPPAPMLNNRNLLTH